MKLPAALDEFFFRPAPAMPLGICRALFFSLLLATYGRVDFGAFGAFPVSFRNPIWLFTTLHIPFVGPTGMSILGWAFKLGLLLTAVGLLTPIGSIVAALAGSYVLAMQNNFGRAGHGDDVIVILLWVMAVSRCGDGFSLDSLRHPAPPPSGEHRWPIRMAWVLMAVVYLAAGITKLRVSGLHWALGDNMAFTLRAHEVNGSDPVLHLGVWIASHPWMPRTLALLTLMMETFFWLALFFRPARWTIVPAMFLGHVFIALVMGVVFWQFMFTYLFWLPWERWVRREAATAKHELFDRIESPA